MHIWIVKRGARIEQTRNDNHRQMQTFAPEEKMPQLITLDSAANRLGVSRRTLERYIERGEFMVSVYQFPNGTIRVDPEDLEDWLSKTQINKLSEGDLQ